MEKQAIISALYAFINQRPGLEFANYGDVSNYRAEMRGITKDRKQALELLRAVERHDSITADKLVEAANGAFFGRLSIVCRDDGKVAIDYCTGQYWPTEYRRAACAVLSAALWGFWREQCMPEPTIAENGDRLYRGMCAGDFLRQAARREFDRSIANRWFR
jgi:hypothetical protein